LEEADAILEASGFVEREALVA